jgi:single-stranded-DNA-specific exonuclease
MMERMTELWDYLYTSRGLETDEDKKNFLKPDFELHTHDPFLFSDMELVVSRIRLASEQGETIGVYTDYDCDGIPGSVILSDFLKKIGITHHVYIPDRQLDGYGLSIKGIDFLIEKGATCIITIDLGVTGFEGALYAKEKGINLIITDHHLPHETLPDAYAIINPKKEGDLYPFKELCGTGVIFKVIQAYLARFREAHAVEVGFEKWLLDMVGLATLADMVPLVGENRVFSYYGLIVMKKTKRTGLLALYTAAGIKKDQLAEDDVTHSLTPRLNAASRMGNAYLSFEVLSTDNPVEGMRLAKELEALNRKRKSHVAEIMKEVHHLPKEVFEKDVIVLGNPKWRPGVLGLVATKVVELYQKPTFVWGGSDEEDTDILKGSCRGVPGMSVVSLMESAKDSFIHYGGHVGAGGFAVDKRHVHDLAEMLQKGIQKAQIEKTEGDVSAHFLLHEPKKEVFTIITQFAPFGMSNEKPIFKSECIQIISHKLFGKTKEHLEVFFLMNGRTYKGIAFFTTEDNFLRPLVMGETYTVIYSMEMSYFIRPELRLKIIDIY